MSTVLHQQSTSHQQTAEQLLQALCQASGLCPNCFARKREYHTEYEADVAEYLAEDKGISALETRGHSVSEDGTLLVDSTACSTPDPGTYYDVVPGTIIEHDDGTRERKMPRAQTICECGVVDFNPEDARSNRELYEAVENIADHLEGEDIEVSGDAMVAYCKACRRHEEGRPDKEILAGAIRFGRKKA